MFEVYSARALRNGCRLMAAEGLVTATDGNLSVLLEDGNVLMTPTGVRKDQVQMKDFVVMDRGGRVCSAGTPSTEYRLHLAVYRMCPEAQAVCHAHPIYATALAGEALAEGKALLFDADWRFEKIQIVEDWLPGSDELAEAVAKAAVGAGVVLMKRHGAMTWGRSVQEACDQMSALERYAKTFALSCGKGAL